MDTSPLDPLDPANPAEPTEPTNVPDAPAGARVGGAITRRDLFETGGKATAAGGALWLADPVPAAVAAGRSGDGEVTVTEGTSISAAASPDGKWVAFDLYNAIWLVPAAGGTARRLTGDRADATRPRFSPDSGRLTFQGYREGNFHIYVLDLPDGEPRRLTSGPHDHREPAFSPDGQRIALASDRSGTGYDIYLHDLGTGELTRVTDTGADTDEGEPEWFPEGDRIVHTSAGTSIRSTAIGGGAGKELVPAREHTTVHAPAPGPGGRLAHVRLHADTCRLVVDGEPVSGDEDVFLGVVTWTAEDRLLYTADGRIRRRTLGPGDSGGAGDSGGSDNSTDSGKPATRDVPFRATVPYLKRRPRPARRDIDDTAEHPVRGIAGPVLAPNGRDVAFRALGALWIMPIGGKPRAVADDGHFNSDPDWHPDGTALVYSSDRSGSPALWRYDIGSGESKRLTSLDGAQVTPRWAPDGRRIAYQDQDGATWVFDTETNAARQVLPALFQPGRPTWSPSGRTLALAAVKPRSQRFREGTSQILTVDLESGATRYTEPAPYKSLSTRGDDGPVWSPDGRHLAFVMDSVLWTVPVDGTGRFAGEPRRLTAEPTDAPSWSGDSASLLYLGNGRLRRIGRGGGNAETIAVDLTWKRPRSADRVIVQAGAVWDGRADRLRRDVDIVIEGNRITAVETRRDRTGDNGTKVIDAAHLTAMPGLIDAHNHWHLRGRFWGARQGPLWLAYGVTTTRSPGDPAYQMLETREALDAGRITGPRYLATGEAIDGSRVYYNFMRPTTGPEEVELELERVFELDYDLVKTYVRLPVSAQHLAVERAHSVDLPLTSHYLYPAVHLGMDGMEHTSATHRLGYSRTVSELGRGYEDVIKLLAASGMSITPTLFTSAALYADDRSLVEDERTRRLFPEWEYRELVAKADAAGSDEPRPRLARKALPANVELLHTVHRRGGLVLSGTDAPLDNIAVSLHQNLRALVKYGFTPHAALTVTTSTAAEWLGLDADLGTVERGKLADLALVEGDPLEDIAAAANVRMTIANGIVHTTDDLMKPFAGVDGAGDADGSAAPRSAPPTATERTPLPAAESGGGHWWHGESERTSPHRC